jgi:hypothetical protein
MVQYILANIYTFSVGSIFLISTILLGLYTLYRASKQGCPERRPTLVFGLALLFFGAAHAIWLYRAAFFPTHLNIAIIFPYWQGFWILFALGVSCISVWGLLMAYPEYLETRKWIGILFLLPWLIITLDILLLANPATAEWVCTALITDVRPDLIVILTVSLPLTLFIGLAFEFYYRLFKGYESKFEAFIVLFGLLLLLIGGIFETRVIPICQVISIGRIMMLFGLWLTAYGVHRIPT